MSWIANAWEIFAARPRPRLCEIRKFTSISRFEHESQKKVASLPILGLDSRPRFSDLSFHSQPWSQLTSHNSKPQPRVSDPDWFNADPDLAVILIADPDPVLDPGFWWPKIGKNLKLTKKIYFYHKKFAIQYSYSYASIKDAQATEEAFRTQKRKSGNTNMNLFFFFFFLWVIFALLDPDPNPRIWRRIRIPIQQLKLMRIADPDPQPCPALPSPHPSC